MSDHLAASEIVKQSKEPRGCRRLLRARQRGDGGGDGGGGSDASEPTSDKCAPCIARGLCVAYVVSRPLERAPVDRFQFLSPGFEFDVETWHRNASALLAYVEQFDRTHKPWARKKPFAIWRGSPNGRHFVHDEWNRTRDAGNPRARLVAFGAAHGDGVISARFTSMPPQEVGWTSAIGAFNVTQRIPQEVFAAARIVLDVDGALPLARALSLYRLPTESRTGGGWSARLPHLMLFNCVLLRMETLHATIYMADLLPRGDEWLRERIDVGDERDDVDDAALVARWLAPGGRAPHGVVWFRDDLGDLLVRATRSHSTHALTAALRSN